MQPQCASLTIFFCRLKKITKKIGKKTEIIGIVNVNGTSEFFLQFKPIDF